jgi:disulfide bond formation protein DsbB
MVGLVRFGNGLGVVAVALVLLVAFMLQFVQKELPCPLCNLQRVALVLCGFAFLLNLRFGSRPAHYGAIILAALFGLAVAGRQVLLHILPGDPGYGPPLMGVHLYTWTFAFFVAVLLGVALLLILTTAGRVEHDRLDGGHHRAQTFGGLSRLVAWFLILMTLANAVASFALCGPIECPDNPTSYWILSR